MRSIYLEELLHILECLIWLEENFSLKDHKFKSFQMVMVQTALGVMFLDRENVDHDTILKHLLEESKVLYLHVNDTDLAIDMLKTVKRLELTHESFQYSRTEVLIAKLYTQLKASIAWKEIRDELFFSLSLSYSSDRTRIMLNAIEFHFPRDHGLSDYPSTFNIEMKDYVSEIFLVTTEEITSAFWSIYCASSRCFLSIAKAKEQIKYSKKSWKTSC